MATSINTPGVEDISSVGTRISWGAILAGAMVALGIYFLLATLAAAGGLSISDRVDPSKLEIGAVAWAFVTTALALFVGGIVASLFTAGENKTEAMLYGAIMWAVLVVTFLHLGAAGIRTGFTAMTAASQSAQAVRVTPTPEGDDATTETENRRVIVAAATRVSWYAFFGMWTSMFAAVAGALVGAGPTFRIASIGTGRRVVVS